MVDTSEGRRLVEMATPGDWAIEYRTNNGWDINAKNGSRVSVEAWHGGLEHVEYRGEYTANGDLIVWLRNNALPMLDALNAQAKEIERLTAIAEPHDKPSGLVHKALYDAAVKRAAGLQDQLDMLNRALECDDIVTLASLQQQRDDARERIDTLKATVERLTGELATAQALLSVRCVRCGKLMDPEVDRAACSGCYCSAKPPTDGAGKDNK